MKKILFISLIISCMNNNIHASKMEVLKDIALGSLAGITSSLILSCKPKDSQNNIYSNLLLNCLIGGTTSLLTFRSFKKREDINSTNCLISLMVSTIILKTNAWPNIFKAFEKAVD